MNLRLNFFLFNKKFSLRQIPHHLYSNCSKGQRSGVRIFITGRKMEIIPTLLIRLTVMPCNQPLLPHLIHFLSHYMHVLTSHFCFSIKSTQWLLTQPSLNQVCKPCKHHLVHPPAHWFAMLNSPLGLFFLQFHFIRNKQQKCYIKWFWRSCGRWFSWEII